jgi:hypothetical protein
MDELREHRDTLCQSLAEDVDLRSMLWNVHSAIDNELADVNHGAVEEEIGSLAAALHTIDAGVRELVELAAVRLPCDPELESRSPAGGVPLPDVPDMVDPLTVQRTELDDVWDEFHVEQQYEDDLRSAWELVVMHRAWHVRHLVDHAAELVGTVIDIALSGNEEGLRPMLAQRDELVMQMGAAVTAWELAVVGRMDVEGNSEHVALVHRWLGTQH